MSDGYIGLDQQYDIHLEVVEAPRNIQKSIAGECDSDYFPLFKDKL